MYHRATALCASQSSTLYLLIRQYNLSSRFNKRESEREF
jgi:hypothetical protein